MISNRTCVFLIFILPISLIFLIFDLTIIMNILADMTPIFTSNDIIWANLSFGLSLGLSIFGAGLAIAFAIWFGYAARLKDFLKESKKSEVDEKIAMLHGYAFQFQDIRRININMNRTVILIKRLQSDIRAIGRIKDSIETSQKEDLIRAKDGLLIEMRNSFQSGS